MNRHHYGLILAGGRGTRFWPLSRKRSAKQVLNVMGERSLIQGTVDRLAAVIPPERMWVPRFSGKRRGELRCHCFPDRNGPGGA